MKDRQLPVPHTCHCSLQRPSAGACDHLSSAFKLVEPQPNQMLRATILWAS